MKWQLLFLIVVVIPLVYSQQTITARITEPAYDDLNLIRIGDKINITFGSEYATIQVFFRYEGETITFSEALDYDVAYDYWINYNTGQEAKFGGMVDTSDVNQNILDNGYYVTFALIDKSEGLNLRVQGGYVYFNDHVRLAWRDNDNPLNKFTIYNSTVVYLSDNGSKFHGDLIYDPQVEVADINIGVFNLTEGTASAIYVNPFVQEFLQAYYTFDVDNNGSSTIADIYNGKTLDRFGGEVVTDGRFNWAYEFAGAEFLDMNALTISQNTTMTAWVYPTNAGVDSAIIGEFGGTPEFLWWLDTDGGELRLAFHDGSNTYYSGKNISINSWSFVAFTDNTTSLVFYINNTRYVTPNVGPAGSYADVHIGDDSAGSKRFVGKLDEITIWNTTFSESDINLIYNRQKQMFNTNGTQTSEVFARNQSIEANTINVTLNSLGISGSGVEGATRTQNWSAVGDFPDIKDLLFYKTMDADNDKSISGNLGFAEGSWSFNNAKNWDFIYYNCTYGGCFYSPDNDLDVQYNFDTVVPLTEFTILVDVWIWDTSSTEPSVTQWENETFSSRLLNMQYDAGNKVTCSILSDTFINRNFGIFQRVTNALIGCRFNGTHLQSIYDGVLNPTPTAANFTNVLKDIYLGNDRFSNDHFAGSIDRYFVFNRSLSASEILAFNDTVLWNSYSDYQTFTSGTDTNNYSVEQNFDFAQVDFKVCANSTDTCIIYPNWNVTFSNYTAGIVAPPAEDSCEPDGSSDAVIQCGDWCNITSLDMQGNNIIYNNSRVPAEIRINVTNVANKTFAGYNCSVYCIDNC